MLRNALLIFLLTLPTPFPLWAAGSYYVGKDAGGVYFQTDRDGGWYIDRADLKFFKIGDVGTYSIGKDAVGSYLSTDKKHRFYLDMAAKAKLDKETEAFNAAQEKRLKDLREDENRRRQKAEAKEAADKDDKQAPQPVKVEVRVTSQEYDGSDRSETYIGPGYYPYPRSMNRLRFKDPSLPKAPPSKNRPGAPGHGTGAFPWWKDSLYPRH